MKEIALWLVGTYALVSACMAIWLFCKGKAWKENKQLYHQVLIFVLLILLWPIFLPLLGKDAIQLPEDLIASLE